MADTNETILELLVIVPLPRRGPSIINRTLAGERE